MGISESKDNHSPLKSHLIVQCYAPTNVDEQQEKDDYNIQLQGVMDKIPGRDIVLVIWDMNAKLGSDNSGRELVMGKEGLGAMNENGELFMYIERPGHGEYSIPI